MLLLIIIYTITLLFLCLVLLTNLLFNYIRSLCRSENLDILSKEKLVYERNIIEICIAWNYFRFNSTFANVGKVQNITTLNI